MALKYFFLSRVPWGRSIPRSARDSNNQISGVPTARTCFLGLPDPAIELPGYYRTSPRDEDPRSYVNAYGRKPGPSPAKPELAWIPSYAGMTEIPRD